MKVNVDLSPNLLVFLLRLVREGAIGDINYKVTHNYEIDTILEVAAQLEEVETKLNDLGIKVD